MLGIDREDAAVELAKIRHAVFSRAHGIVAEQDRAEDEEGSRLATTISEARAHCGMCVSIYEGIELCLQLAAWDGHSEDDVIDRARDWMTAYARTDQLANDGVPVMSAVAADLACALASAVPGGWAQAALDNAVLACRSDSSLAPSLAYVVVDTMPRTTQVDQRSVAASARTDLSAEIARHHPSWQGVHRWLAALCEVEVLVEVNASDPPPAGEFTQFVELLQSTGVTEVMCKGTTPPCGLDQSEIVEIALEIADVAMLSGYPAVTASIWAQLYPGDRAVTRAVDTLAGLEPS